MFFCCGDLLAYSNKATDAAFAALLSMPGGGPASGQWGTPVPDDFSPSTESALIAYLARQQKAGADFNAVRHRGTLLHHAIRTGKSETATWLLAHGADPAKTVEGIGDALALSLAYQRTVLARLLRDKYRLSTPATAAPATPATPATPIALSDVDAARVLLSKVSWLAITTRSPTPGAITNSANAEEYRQLSESWSSVSAGMAPDVYARVMDDDSTVSNLVILHSRSPAALEQALARIPAPVLKRHANAAVAALARQSSMEVDRQTKAIQYKVPAEVWRVLWRRLGKPLDYGDSPSLARNVQPELWPGLLASGYDGNPDYALGCMLTEIGAPDLKAFWAQLLANFPRVREDAPGMILAQYRFAGRELCWETDRTSTRDKLLFLTSVGVKAPVHGILKQSRDQAPDLLAAMRPFLPVDADQGSAPAPRLVDAAAKCTFSLTDPWFRKLRESTVEMSSGGNGAPVDIATVQLVEIPGEAECGLLVGGYLNWDDLLLGVVADSFTGPERNPNPSCPDPSDRSAVWQNRQGKIIELQTNMGADNGSPTLIPVRDTLTGQRYYLHSGEQYGRCTAGRRLPFTYEWRRAGNDWSLMRTGFEKHHAALFDQCSDDEQGGARCRGIAALSIDPSVEKKSDPFTGMDVAEFLKSLGQTRYRAYMQAVVALDKPRLNEIRAAGVPARWTAEALVQISRSDLTVPAKRARVAWMFADRPQLEHAFNGEVFNALLPWLPREDWRPVLAVIAKRPDYFRESLQTGLADQSHSVLACDISNALGLVCGEQLQAD